jgi:two-component system, OmpR family, sensor kinase
MRLPGAPAPDTDPAGRRVGWRRGVRWLAGLPLWLKLAAAMTCLTAMGLAAIGVTGVPVLRGYLISQVDVEMEAGAGTLAGHPFVIGPTGGPPLGGFGATELSVEVLDNGGARLEPVGPGSQSGPVLHAGSAWITAHLRRPVTVAAGGQSWRVIMEPVRYQARHVPFIFGANDYSVAVAGAGAQGLPGTLVIGTSLADIGRQTSRLAAAGLAAGAVALVLLAALGIAAIRAGMWRAAPVEAAARGVAAGDLSSRVPEHQATAEIRRLARVLNATLDRVEVALREAAQAETASRAATEAMRQRLVGAGQDLRAPLSVVAGLAASYRRRATLAAGELDRMMSRVAQEADRMAETAKTLGAAARTGGAPAHAHTGPAERLWPPGQSPGL